MPIVQACQVGFKCVATVTKVSILSLYLWFYLRGFLEGIFVRHAEKKNEDFVGPQIPTIIIQRIPETKASGR